jgi:hypothetical protein
MPLASQKKEFFLENIFNLWRSPQFIKFESHSIPFYTMKLVHELLLVSAICFFRFNTSVVLVVSLGCKLGIYSTGMNYELVYQLNIPVGYVCPEIISSNTLYQYLPGIEKKRTIPIPGLVVLNVQKLVQVQY